METGMNAHVKTVVEDCTKASDEARLAFPQIVQNLMAAGVERYHADLLRAEKTYYWPDGGSHVVAAHGLDRMPAAAFSAAGVEAAVRASQAGRITYKEFCVRIAEAGCVDYIVSLAGRRAVYFGRTGENHVEMFPGAN
jgi:uncharacterized protein YbcV (DUF1398 family)